MVRELLVSTGFLPRHVDGFPAEWLVSNEKSPPNSAKKLNLDKVSLESDTCKANSEGLWFRLFKFAGILPDVILPTDSAKPSRNESERGFSKRNKSQEYDTRNCSRSSPGLSPRCTRSSSLEADESVCHTEFRHRKTLGKGTFGRVKLVENLRDGKLFALKVLRKTKVRKLLQVQNTYNEKAILLQLQHPHIIKLYSTFTCDDNLYMLFEYLPGGDLFHLLRSHGRFSTKTVKFFVGNVVLAFEKLHSLGVAHRDLKPENLLLDGRGYLKLADFGFAKQLLRKTHTICGTMDYVAPEIINHQGHDCMVDWWSLGVLLYELLTGFPPFCSETKQETFQKIQLGTFYVDFPAFFDEELKHLISNLLVVNPRKRLGSQHGANEIKSHPWFNNFGWNALAQGEMKAPMVPNKRNTNLTSGRGDDFPESVVDESETLDFWCRLEDFKDF